MKINITEKPVMTKFVTINGVEFELSRLYGSIYQIMNETEENDHYGEYSLRSYELNDKETMDKLVAMGYVKNYTGSRMANLYCMANEKGLKELLNALNDAEKEN